VATVPPEPPGRRANRRTRSCRRQFDALPAAVGAVAVAKFRLFLADPAHPSLHHHALTDTAGGTLRPGSFSVSINMQYRAIYTVTADGANLWYWVGTHAEYNRLTGKGS